MVGYGKQMLNLQWKMLASPVFITVDVYVVAPDANLAQYIVTTMYPEFESLSVDDEPVTPESYGRPTV